MSKIAVVYDQRPELGVPLSAVDYGTLVRRTTTHVLYLVVSRMDGTGLKALCTLQGGVIRDVPQDLEVAPLSATLTVHGIDQYSMAWGRIASGVTA